MKKMYILSILSLVIILAAVLVSCGVSNENAPSIPSPSPFSPASASNQVITDSVQSTPVVELQTISPENSITNFRVLTDEEKAEQIYLRQNDHLSPMPIVEWNSLAKSCPYTIEEIISQVSVGDDLKDVYECIGSPTYRDSWDAPPSRGMDLRFMSYRTADGGVIWICPMLAGSSEEDYHYVVACIVVHENMSGYDEPDVYQMDYDTMVTMEIIPVFMAVEQKGVNYLLENDLITPYEATLYAAEEAAYQAAQAQLAARELQPSVVE